MSNAKKEERNDDKSKPSVILSEAKDLPFVRITTNTWVSYPAQPGWGSLGDASCNSHLRNTPQEFAGFIHPTRYTGNRQE
jgi:hypothetical protein